jgi:hypothetical protein
MKRVLPLIFLAFALPTPADTLIVPLGEQGDRGIPLPAPGETKRAVLERFGLADEEHPAVGRPPITRWDYRAFSVYFENDRVIEAVLQHQPSPPQER